MACDCLNFQTLQTQKQVEQAKIYNFELVNPNVFEIAIPIKTKDAQLTKGKYRLYFNISNLTTNQILFLFENFGGEQNKTFTVAGKRITYLRGYGDKELRYFITEIEIIDNPIPVNAIVYGLLLLFGAVAGYMLLEKIEKIIEVSKPFALAITLFAVIILINIFK